MLSGLRTQFLVQHLERAVVVGQVPPRLVHRILVKVVGEGHREGRIRRAQGGWRDALRLSLLDPVSGSEPANL